VNSLLSGLAAKAKTKITSGSAARRAKKPPQPQIFQKDIYNLIFVLFNYYKPA